MITGMIIFAVLIGICAYFRVSLIMTTLLVGILLLALQLSFGSSTLMNALWVTCLVTALLLNTPAIRKPLVSRAVFSAMKNVMPAISQTEQEALDAGDVWWEVELFSGKPDFNVIRQLPAPRLSVEEQAFLDGPVETFCQMLDDWQITQVDYDLSEAAWQFAKDNRFFAMIIPKQYGGLGYSALCHSQVVMKIGSRSGSAAVTVMVPNSLGPGKLLMTCMKRRLKVFRPCNMRSIVATFRCPNRGIPSPCQRHGRTVINRS